MLTIQRLNMDSSWLIRVGDIRLLVDPWLIGSEIDGFKWLNEQWHVTDPVPIKDIPAYDYLLITQSYEDHCHLETLWALDTDKPIIATAKAYKRLGSKFPGKKLILIPDEQDLELDGVKLGSFHPGNRMDPVYYGVSIQSEEHAVYYCPHGFELTNRQLERLSPLQIDLLITTFTYFKIPKIMGGLVNPGLENVRRLVDQLNPAKVINTHDEEKKARGLVGALAKITYPDYDFMEKHFSFERLNNYEPVQVTG